MLSYFLQVLIGVALATSIEYIVPISFKLPADKDDKQKPQNKLFCTALSPMPTPLLAGIIVNRHKALHF
jgi:energy-converting hydrogenase Eha subunit A